MTILLGEEDSSIPGLVGYFPFNGDCTDSASLGNHGSSSGTVTTVNDRNGSASSAFDISGTNSRITIPTNAAYDTDGTISFWFRTSGSWSAASVTDAPVIYRTPDTGYGGFNIMIDNSANGGEITLQIKDDIGTMVLNITGTIDVTDNIWHHIVLTYEMNAGGAVTLVLDGNTSFPEISGTTSGAWTFDNHDLIIGDMTGTWWAEWSGEIDEVRIYDRVLTNAEIATLYQY